MGLLEVYTQLQTTSQLPESLWDEWLWQTDPEEKYSPDVLLNRCQLLGLLVCIYKGLTAQAETCLVEARLTLMEKPIHAMTLRELKDTIENLQMEWPSFLQRLPDNPNAQQNLDGVVGMIDQCMARFGVLCAQAGTPEVMDDLCSVDSHQDHTTNLLRVTTACIRRTICTFLVLYRHLHLLAVAKPVPDEWCDCGISKYHVEASSDDFNLLCMHLCLPVAGRLNYKHDFPEMYNHVSQVVFFHNPEYQRIPRTPLEKLSTAPLEQVLPAIWQLYPDIGVKYEEDMIDLVGKGKGWWWLVVAGRVYLVDPDNGVWYSPNVTSLLQHVYMKRPGS